MSVVVIAGTLALLVWVVVFVGQPLVQARTARTATESDAERRRKELRFQRDMAYAAIRELEADHALGTLSAQDLHALREQYTMRAATVLKELDVLEAGMAQESEVEIEEAVARYRSSRPSTG